MNKAFTMIALAAASLLFAPATAEPAWTGSGSFLIGEPLGFYALDACGASFLQGINSSCIGIPADTENLIVSLVAGDAAGSVLESGTCFYAASAFIECGSRVPVGATHMSVFALGGVGVTWTASIA